MESEIWLPVPGYETLYEASSYGKVRSLERKRRNGATVKGRILKGCPSKGYLRHTLHKDGKQKTPSAHRVVAITFIDNPNDLPSVNHKDGVKTNNVASNLEWCTPKDNTQHAIKVLGQRRPLDSEKCLICGKIFHAWRANTCCSVKCGLAYRHRYRPGVGISNYRGVTKREGKWKAYILVNSKKMNIGTYATELEAAQVYNVKARELFGDDTYLNPIADLQKPSKDI